MFDFELNVGGWHEIMEDTTPTMEDAAGYLWEAMELCMEAFADIDSDYDAFMETGPTVEAHDASGDERDEAEDRVVKCFMRSLEKVIACGDAWEQDIGYRKAVELLHIYRHTHMITDDIPKEQRELAERVAEGLIWFETDQWYTDAQSVYMLKRPFNS